MADNVLSYPRDAQRIAKAAGVHPGEVEICAFCEKLAPPRHPGCPIRPFDVIIGALSSRGYDVPRPKGPLAFAWRKLSSGAFRVRPKPSRKDWVWSLRNIVADAVWADVKVYAYVPADTIAEGWWPSFDIHCWEADLTWGRSPERIEPDMISFSLELHPVRERALR